MSQYFLPIFIDLQSMNWNNILIGVANDLIDKVYPLVTILIPIVFSIINFIYKERKEIAYNVIQEKKGGLTTTLFVFTGINLIIYLFFYIRHLNNTKREMIEGNIESLIIISSLVLLIILLLLSYRRLLHSINIFKLYDKHLRKISNYNTKIKHIGEKVNDSNIEDNIRLGRKFRKILKGYNNSSQIIGQILIAQLEFNMVTDFTRTLNEFMYQQEKFFNLVNFQYAKEVIALYSFKEKSDIYKDGLNINYQLLERTANYNKREETESALGQYIKLIPGEIDVTDNVYKSNSDYVENMKDVDENTRNYYFKNLIYAYETTSKYHYFEMNNLFNKLLEKSDDSSVEFNTNNIFTTFYVLIMQAIYNNDIKMLTNFVNLSFILVSNQRENIIKDSEGEDPYTYDESLSKILIVAMTKSVELGHYSCAGFLVKISVSHQKKLQLNKVFATLKKMLDEQILIQSTENDVNLNSKDIRMNLLKEMNYNNTLSSRSFDYCYFKVSFLIIKQQRYLASLEKYSEERTEILKLYTINFDEKSVHHIHYMEGKLKNMHREYGMLALKHN